MKTLIPIACFLCFCPFPLYGKIYINIGAPQKLQKSLIALAPFALQGASSPDDISLGRKMRDRFQKNLKISGYFNILSPKAFIEDPSQSSSYPRPQDPRGFIWKNWRLAGADFLFFGSWSVSQEGQLQLNSSLHNINLQKTALRKQYTGARAQYNKIIDLLTNDIIKALTGKKSIFETKILVVKDSPKKQIKELFIMDWDGRNQKQITRHRSIVMSPVWSNDGGRAAYSAFVYNKKLKKKSMGLFLYHFKTNKIKLLFSRARGMLAGDFMPNGKEILLSSTIGPGRMDISLLNIKTSALSPLTKGPRGAIHVEPNIQPKSRNIAFSSDLTGGGRAMIWTMSARGSNQKRLTFAGKYNSQPVWMPDPSQLIFAGLSRGKMDLFKISAQGGGLKRLTGLRKQNGSRASCESPDLSPDGKFIVFRSDVSGTWQIYIMNTDTLSVERITFDRRNYQSPKWSPWL